MFLFSKAAFLYFTLNWLVSIFDDIGFLVHEFDSSSHSDVPNESTFSLISDAIEMFLQEFSERKDSLSGSSLLI